MRERIIHAVRGSSRAAAMPQRLPGRDPDVARAQTAARDLPLDEGVQAEHEAAAPADHRTSD